ncbi:MAG: hypothetical protein WDZ50_04510 [Woeseia sp.]
MRQLKLAGLVLVPFFLGACGASSVCEEPRRYQASQPGKRIEAPEGLDSLQPQRELTIPDASPRPPRPEGGPCLETPPVYRVEDN